MMNLSRQQMPRYLEIAQMLREQLATYQVGEYFPSEMTLAEHFGVNRHTLRRAVDELVAEGRVLRHQGRGTCVLAPPIVYPLSRTSTHSETLQSMGFRSRAVLLHKHERIARADEVLDLHLQANALVLELETLRYLDEQPISLITHCFAARYRHLVNDYRGGSIREHLSQKGIRLMRMSTLIGARTPSQRHALRLMMPRSTPVLTIRTLSCGPDGHPFELSRSLSRADRFNYHVNSGEHSDE